MGSTICVLVMPEPGTEEGVALIFQRIYPEKQDVVQFESEDLRTSSMLAFSDGVLYVTVFSHHFNSQAALYGKETYVETADPPETRVTRLVVDRYGDQWEITCGVRTTVRQRFTRPKHLNIWIARSITYPDTKSFGFNLSSSPENLLSTVSSIRHDLLP